MPIYVAIIAPNLPLIFIFLIGGLVNLLFPKQVVAMCKWVDEVVPYGSKGAFADAGETLYRVGGGIIVAICIVVLLLRAIG